MPPDLAYLLRGLVIGFSIAAPVGPIGLLCIRRTVAYGRLSGLFTGLGAATADSLYGAVAGFGLTTVSAFLISQEQVLRAVGGLFLLFLGIRIILTRRLARAVEAKDAGLVWDYVSTLALTLTNPVTILCFAAVFTGVGIVRAQSHAAAGLLVVGVFCGSMLWWSLLSAAVAATRQHLPPKALAWINGISGLAICGFGLFILWELARGAMMVG